MKKLILAVCLTVTAANSFAGASFLAGLHDKKIAIGGAITTTVVSVQFGLLYGLLVFADNGDAFINLGSEEAQDALKLAVQKSLDGEELTAEDQAIIEIYANSTGLSQAELISKVAAEL